MLRTQTPIFPASLEVKSKRKARTPMMRTSTPTAHKRSTSRNSRTYSFYQPSPTPSRGRTKSIDKPRPSSSQHKRSVKSRQFFSQDSEALVERGKQQLVRQEFKEAIETFSQVLRSERNLDALYSRAVSYMHLNNHKLALPDLLQVGKESPLFDKHLYVALAMCFVAAKDLVAALRHISKGLSKFPRFVEGFIVRGQLYNQQQTWEKAIGDFRKAISLNAKEGGAFIGLADSLIGFGDSKTAIKVLTQAITCPETRLSALLKRGKLYYSLKKYDKALEDLDKYIAHQPEDPEAFYTKSMLLLDQKMYNEAVLSLEQVLKFDSANAHVGTAIFHLGAIKIRERDFYGALHTFKRAPVHLQLKEQAILSSYAESVINLMKRKYKEGVSSFTKLIRKNYPVIREYIGNCHAFRGYGFAAMGKHEKALKDFKAASSFNSLDKASKFNQTVSRGLVHLNKGEKDSALSCFGSALRQFPRNPDPLLYHAAVLIASSYQSGSKQQMSEAEELLNRAVRMRDSEAEVFFFRAVLKYLVNKPQEALEDIKQAIDKAEDNMAEHYLIRGLCQTAVQDFQEGMQDFSIAIQLDENMQDAYSYRARCAYLLDDTNVAFGDIQKLLELAPKDVNSHIQAGNLFMLAGSYDEALESYANANHLQMSPEAITLSAKTHILRGNLDAATAEISRVLAIKHSESLSCDKEILGILSKLLGDKNYSKALNALENFTQKSGEIFEEKYIRWFRGVGLMYTGQYSFALAEFQRVLEIIHSHDPADMNSDEALTAEEENCEILYNIALCHMPTNKSHALLILQDLSEVLNSKHRGQMLFVSGLIEMALGNNAKAEQSFKEAARCDPESVSPFFNKKTTVILPLNTSNEFSAQFELIDLPIPSDTLVRIRPAVSLPRVRPPGFDFGIEHQARGYFTVQKITPKPEAPWLNRVRGSIQFTDAMFEVESEASEETAMEPTEEDAEEEKRLVKSALALRHLSSGSLGQSNDIADRIRAICQNNH